jgi:Mor family transcriptional regulator
MSYVKANNILPKELLKEIQKYIQGKTIYIPKEEGNYIKWGTYSGGRKKIDHRNSQIKKAFKAGATMTQLADKYFLSIETIKSIVYAKNK